ncbi:hypothetical protein J2W51_006091 [Tardiphaga robiniae]|jgi:hypothetical protein|uniref:hypothetical protein n=1 Tax=Tardiphaga robiniae TaxID=943830 RepID=UPI00285C5CDB|nr:hypothetical protein [Tardiphaga robiniae]MDR6663497.1 hypothetical protein [Tardiphaga robiniae]
MSCDHSEELDVPADGLSFDPPIQIYHLTGGLSLMTGSNRLAALMSPGGPGMTFFSMNKKTTISSCLAGQKDIRVIGRNHFSVAEEMQDAITSNFSIPTTNRHSQCLAHAQATVWSELANGLHLDGRGADSLIANRVASQIRLCLSRLERLSHAYRTVLMAITEKNRTPSETKFTNDKYSQHIGSEYRSVLNELYSLRDAILAGTHRLRFQKSEPYKIGTVKASCVAETSKAAELIFESMFAEGGDRLIDHMSLHRAVAQHCLGATNPIFGDVYSLRSSNGPYGLLPYLVFPLYDDIGKMREIEQGSSKGILERPPKDEAIRFMSLERHQDALEFSYDCFERLLKICELVQLEIDVEPRPMTLTENEILELTITDENGNTRRAKRDEVTGKLVYY